MRRTKAEIMNGINSQESRVIDNNTIRYVDAHGNTIIRLHLTDIIIIKKNGDVVLNSGGWKTVTTKSRMNEYQNVAQVVQAKSVWYVKSRTGYDESIFYDGIEIKADGMIVNPEVYTDTPKTIKLIKAYCKKLAGMDEIPTPSDGDCWYCYFRDTETGLPMGHKQRDHLMEHLRQKYIHGSLILNALKDAGYANPGLIYQMGLGDTIVSAVSRYFKVQLGIPR
jgi:hypothetical protein